MVVERVVRFGEGTVVIGTCKKPAWTLMMSCGTWNERESKCVLSMRVVSFFEWGRVLYYTGHRYLPCRYWWLWCLDSVGGQDTETADHQAYHYQIENTKLFQKHEPKPRSTPGTGG